MFNKIKQKMAKALYHRKLLRLADSCNVRLNDELRPVQAGGVDVREIELLVSRIGVGELVQNDLKRFIPENLLAHEEDLVAYLKLDRESPEPTESRLFGCGRDTAQAADNAAIRCVRALCSFYRGRAHLDNGGSQ